MKPMLCKSINQEEFKYLENGYIFQEKKDGVRVILNNGMIFNRAGKNITHKFPELSVPRDVILDGELIAGDFNGTLSRINTEGTFNIKVKAKNPACVFIFDVLELGHDLKGKPLEVRFKILSRLDLPKGLEVLPFYDNPASLNEHTSRRDYSQAIRQPLY